MKSAWYVLHVKPRTEKKVTERLKIFRLWHYLPLYKKTTRVQRRKVVRMLPIFPGYVFARLNQLSRLEVLKTNLVVRVIEVPNQRELIHQLRQIMRVSRNSQDVRVVEKFNAGDKIRIKHGPFYGIEGYVKSDDGGLQIVVNVDILGQAVAVKLSPSDVEHTS